MVNTKVTLCGIEMDNPIIPASGTFGFGYEFAELYDINVLGTFSFKGTTRELRFGNPTPRIAEYAGGLLNAVGLQNPGVDAVIATELPKLKQVIERSTSNWSRTLTLNKGTGLGVAIGDCVVDQYGYLVGVVTEAGANWCTVTTILDTDSQLGALVFRTGEVTVAMGDLALMGQGKLKLSYLEGESSLINGDMIVTSGLGGYYPSGLVIGSVEEIKTDDNGLTRYATIVPKTDITQLVEVFVITDFTIVD